VDDDKDLKEVVIEQNNNIEEIINRVDNILDKNSELDDDNIKEVIIEENNEI
jgi:hypothetical protein